MPPEPRPLPPFRSSPSRPTPTTTPTTARVDYALRSPRCLTTILSRQPALLATLLPLLHDLHHAQQGGRSVLPCALADLNASGQRRYAPRHARQKSPGRRSSLPTVSINSGTQPCIIARARLHLEGVRLLLRRSRGTEGICFAREIQRQHVLLFNSTARVYLPMRCVPSAREGIYLITLGEQG